MLFEPTYVLKGAELELAEEDMFELERSFWFHEADTPTLKIDTAHLGRGVRLCRVRSTGHTISLDEPDHVTVLVPRSGRMTVETGRRSYAATPGQMLIFAPNARTTHVLPSLPGGFESHCLLVPATSRAHGHVPSEIPEQSFSIAGSDPRAFGLRQLISIFFGDGFQSSSGLESEAAKDAAGILLGETLGYLLQQASELVPNSAGPSARDHVLVRTAEDRMREHYRERLSISGLADHLGVSVRRLQVAFVNAQGKSPLEALRSVRLELVRQRLLESAGGETVTQIAMESGFFHLGRFSRAYQEAFGETPSKTLRRARI